MTLKRKQQGFTIVELLIVIVVIGILMTLVIVTFTGIQQKARNTKRTNDIKIFHSQVEAYFAQNAKYPSLSQINDSTWRGTNLKGIDPDTFKEPRWTSAAACSAGTPAAPILAAAVSDTCYGYTVTPANCDNAAGGDCTGYTLTANLEGGGTTTKSNLN